MFYIYSVCLIFFLSHDLSFFLTTCINCYQNGFLLKNSGWNIDLLFSRLLKHFLFRRYRKYSGVTCDHTVFSLTSRMKAVFLVCVLGLLAASLAEDSAQTEPVDVGAGLERGVRDVTDVTEELEDVDTDTDTDVKDVNRQKRRC